MVYRQMGSRDVKLSAIGLGGHEFLPNGSSRGFNEDSKAAVRPGYKGVGYGQEKRRKLMEVAFEHGINFFDVTIDPEKEALGRNLKQVKAPYEVFVQTRPEGMGYGYDPHNAKMARLDLLREEVRRILKLLKRECIEILNLPFLQDALDHDPEYLDKMRFNVTSLKKEGLIRFASADNFSGESTYLAQIDSSAFDSLALNFNFGDNAAMDKVIPHACEKGMAVVTREAFLKGGLFGMGDAIGVTDRSLLARIGLKWNLGVTGVTSVLVGADNVEHLKNSLSALEDMSLGSEEREVFDRLKESPAYLEYTQSKRQQFLTPNS